MLTPFGDVKNRGSVSFAFCLVAVLLVGIMSYSFLIGQQVERKIALQNSADAGIAAMNNHSAQGINMIAANNLAIGASLHVAASLPILAAYSSVAYVFTREIWDSAADVAKKFTSVMTLGLVQAMDDYQKNIWNKISPFAAYYFRMAVGMTKFNAFIVDYWMVPAPIRNIEISRINYPGSIVVPLQERMFEGDFEAEKLFMKYEGLKVASPKQTLCHSLRASKEMTDADRLRDQVYLWMTGPLKTIPGASSSLSKAEGVLDLAFKVQEKLFPMKLVFMGCGYGLRSPLTNLIRDMVKLVVETGSGELGEALMSVDAAKYIHDVQTSREVSGTRGQRNGRKKKYGVTYHKRPLCDTRFKGAASLGGFRDLITEDNRTEYTVMVTYSKVLKKQQKEVRATPVEPVKTNYVCESTQSVNGDVSWRSVLDQKYFEKKESCLRHVEAKFSQDFSNWERKRSPYYCDTFYPDGELEKRHYGQLPHTTKKDVKTCIDLRNVDYRCPIKKYIRSSFDVFGSCQEYIRKKVDAWKSTCSDFDDYNTTRDSDLLIVDWGQQIDTYVNGGSMDIMGFEAFSWDPKDVEKQLGFTIIDDEELFRKSRQFLTIMAHATEYQVGDAGPTCPDELKVEIDGHKSCEQLPIVTMQNLLATSKPVIDTKGTDDDEEAEMKDGESAKKIYKLENEINAMSGGMSQTLKNQSKALGAVWGRTIWVRSHAETVKRRQTVDVSAQLFWPDWYPKLRYEESGFLDKAMGFLIK